MTHAAPQPTIAAPWQSSELIITAPATGEVIETIVPASIADLDVVVSRARKAQPEWAENENYRRELLHRLADLTELHADELIALGARETGKPSLFAGIEPHWSAEHLRWIADAQLPPAPEFEVGGEHIRVERTPMGVVGAIIPWNVPMVMAVHKFAAAARMGNTVIIKPSPFTPLATRRWVQLAQQVLPEGVLQIVIGHDDLGKALVSHPGVDMIAFTGSTATGQSIMRAAAEDLKPLALELGGNDAAIVLPDAPIEQFAQDLFMGAFLLSGQVCQAIKRLYVHRSQYERLGQLLAQLAAAQVLGGPEDAGATFGPLVTKAQHERVSILVEDARSRGARILTGGKSADRPGNFYEPTILLDVPDDARIVVEEQFGPALPVLVYDDVEEAMERANSSKYGLGGSIWTADIDTGTKLARRLQTGSVWVNAHATIHPAVNFGGVKHSGLGREGGVEGLLGYSELQTIHLPGIAAGA
ncbi:aldehyde dehydrogenase family protein [Glutamicibacter arilaitensis]|uniref:aldehyde dehydrogenase family protein n=1 Tax=Glutamicibacter arilaitensis TaxID=256701 RepID=UPI0038511F86